MISCIKNNIAIIVRAGLFTLATVTITPLVAQKKVKLQHSDQLEFNKQEGYQKLIGNVVFTQNQTTIYCDSAYLYKDKNSIDAFGRVKITEGDSVTVTSRRLEYDGNTKKAKLRNNVVFVKLNTATLYTDHLDYDRPSNLAVYFDGGKMVDTINTLTSNKGYYDVNSNMASFKKDVHVKNPDYTMTSDSLQYNSRSKIVYFRTPTTAVDNEGKTFVYEGGEYDTRTKRSDFLQGIAESPSYQLKGTDWKLDRIRQVYQVRKDVVMTSKKDNLIIHCQAADYYKAKEITKAYDNAWVAKVTENNDTLFISADTLVSIDSPDPTKKRLLAYHHVRIFKTDMQGIADSLEYRASDSTIIFYKNPVLWNKGNQMTADSITMLIENNTIKRIFMVKNSFVISQDTILNFNQIKGRNMTAEMEGGQINRVYVEGNGESLYFILDDEDKSFTGMNKIVCSNILIRFKDGRADNLSFYVQPDASFIPPHELQETDKQLKGFTWKIKERPGRKDVVPVP
ncbi:MAG TPA: OstA-like protein [Cyclobacteriaceae bacterium]|nr:OstA-like protein [Cyclobacteriaceae bacterium]